MKEFDPESDVILCVDCETPLVSDFSRPGKEWRCPKCGRFTEFFDDHLHRKYGELNDEQKKALQEIAS